MADLEFYKSLKIDEFDPSNNGDDIDTDALIESGVLNNLLLPVRPYTAEIGGERYFKFFIKATVDVLTLGLDVASFTTSPTEEIYLFEAGSNTELESDLDKSNLRLYGGFLVTAYDKDNKKVTADRDVSKFVKADDKITFYKEDNTKLVTWEVENINGSEITFKTVSDDDVSNLKASSTIFLDALNKDEYKGFWVKEMVPPFTEPMEDPANEFILNIWYDLK